MITDFGDVAVTVPLIVLAVFYLLVFTHRARLGAMLAGVTASTGAMMLALKVCLRTCSAAPVGPTHVLSPSGHAAMSTVVYGSFALISSLGSSRRVAILAGAMVLVVAIAVSRLVLDAHTPLEILVGLVIGGGFTVLFGWLVRKEEAISVHRLPLLLIILVSIGATHGFHAPAEEAIKTMARDLQSRFPICEP